MILVAKAVLLALAVIVFYVFIFNETRPYWPSYSYSPFRTWLRDHYWAVFVFVWAALSLFFYLLLSGKLG